MTTCRFNEESDNSVSDSKYCHLRIIYINGGAKIM